MHGRRRRQIPETQGSSSEPPRPPQSRMGRMRRRALSPWGARRILHVSVAAFTASPVNKAVDHSLLKSSGSMPGAAGQQCPASFFCWSSNSVIPAQAGIQLLLFAR